MVSGFLAVPQGCLRFVIVVFPDHTHLLFLQSSHWGRECRLLYFCCVLNAMLLLSFYDSS